MKPSIAELEELCPAEHRDLLREHVQRLGDEYFAVFAPAAVTRHVTALAGLSVSNPVTVLVDEQEGGQIDCTVLAFDYPSEFSLITGLLAATGFAIDSGQVFTYRRLPAARRKGDRRRRCIIDHFRGRLTAGSVADWREVLAQRLGEVLSLLEGGGDGETRQARNIVNEMVAEMLARRHPEYGAVLYPVQIEFDNQLGPFTRLKVVSQDTPAFLYAFSNALALRGIIIERVSIRTVSGRVEDEIDVLDSRGEGITEEARLDQIRLSVLLTKQFTHFVVRSPDPYAALSRFELLVNEVLSQPERGRWLDLFCDPRALEGLAKILGASDFIWEDFVRTQYESLLPMLGRGEETVAPAPAEDPRRALATALEGIADLREQRRIVNRFKDLEAFRIDLRQILAGDTDVGALALPLTRLAEAVVDAAVRCVYEELAGRYGVPRTVGGLTARYAVFGLGKLGGEALGYASDIELLFAYSDSGRTDGAQPLSNAEFFERMAAEAARFIEARREGIFRVDLRLRPYGNSGPKACSLGEFCRYYGPDGAAHSYERLALVRLRAVAGDGELGLQIERLRDAYLYTGQSVNVEELRQLRERQFSEKVDAGRLNAKFSPGALVDLEYYVQILQVQHGGERPALRTPRVNVALGELSRAGVLDGDESRALAGAYYFLRRVINGMRMLRGHALDLCFPPEESLEYTHLARRMGYEINRGLSPARRLRMDFDAHTAVVRTFIERHFGREALPDSLSGNVADLVLSDEASPELQERVLRASGFVDVRRAYANLRRLAGQGARRESFAWLAVLALDTLTRSPDPDMALNNWERFAGQLPDPENHFGLLLAQPRRLEILMQILAGSQFLADTLVGNPDFLDWATDPANLHTTRGHEQVRADMQAMAGMSPSRPDWLRAARRLRKREILRIGTCDLCLGAPLEETVADLSTLAGTVIDVLFDQEWRAAAARLAPGCAWRPEDRFCVMAFGKLGGEELNYSSDVDLLGVFDDSGLGRHVDDARQLYRRILEELRSDLSGHTGDGYAYRVDLRLRPYGGAGEIVQSVSSLERYFAGPASLWEIQALLKARPVAGSRHVGSLLMERLKPALCRERPGKEIADSIGSMRRRALETAGAGGERDLKNGIGGIREIEFLVQGRQLRHLASHPDLLEGNTLRALARLVDSGLLPSGTGETLRADYIFLRRLEHVLQILHDRQVHALPSDTNELRAVARRVLGPEAGPDELSGLVESARERVHAHYVQTLSDIS